VADEHHRPLDAAQDAGQVGGVGLQAAQWVSSGDDRVPLRLQPGDDAVEARRVGERTMHQHDGGRTLGGWGSLAEHHVCSSDVRRVCDELVVVVGIWRRRQAGWLVTVGGLDGQRV